MQILSCAHTCDISKLRQNAFYLKYHVAFFFRQILKCCSKRICPKCVAYFPLLVFSSWGSLLTFLCKANFHFHSGSYTWNIQIWLLIAFKADATARFENKFHNSWKEKGEAVAVCDLGVNLSFINASCKECSALQWHLFWTRKINWKVNSVDFYITFASEVMMCSWMLLCNGMME